MASAWRNKGLIRGAIALIYIAYGNAGRFPWNSGAGHRLRL
ncbi:hypothetical protein BN2476_230103 [Paraburkholderia piptadeniae]|uniref:Uncharacterized protein n=1 Tax=Paraburkholderia piptadeniae TaxID=1701573 RepID=A0A1N7RWY5_9BURK|nr:hypothetical protein BN2476_230103 [Paraburkholderia piptadeniae]